MAQVQVNKKDQAAKIYTGILAKKSIAEGERRQEFIKQATEKCGLSASGASTYFANFKNGNWSVDAKPVAKTATAKPAPAKKVTASAKPVAKPAAKAAATKAPVTKPARKSAAKKATPATQPAA